MISFTSSTAFLRFFFNDTATTEIYTLSLHDALPILSGVRSGEKQSRGSISSVTSETGTVAWLAGSDVAADQMNPGIEVSDRKSTRLNSQSRQYLVCRLLLEKKKQTA